MGQVINFPRHHQHRCGPQCCGCQFCHGGLFLCTRCGSYEGATTSDCPGVRMSMERSDDVYHGRMNFRAGRWIRGASPHSPAYYQRGDQK